MLPEVIFFSKTEYFFCWYSNLLIPDIESFIICLIYRWIQTILIQSNYFC